MNSIARHATLLASLSALTLAACEAEEQTEPARDDARMQEQSEAADETDAPEPATPASPLEDAGLTGAAVSFEGSGLFEALEASEGLETAPSPAGVILTGEMANPGSGGRTSGARLMLDAETAQALAGSTITVTIIARSTDGAGLRAAYSTAQFGNSGWNDWELGSDFASVDFDYDLPAGEDINEDYLGLAPQGGSVEIAAVAVSRAN